MRAVRGHLLCDTLFQVEEMSQQTFIKQDDIVSTLQSYNLVQYWKGQV